MPVHGKHHRESPERQTYVKEKAKALSKSVLLDPPEVSKSAYQTAVILEDPALEIEEPPEKPGGAIMSTSTLSPPEGVEQLDTPSPQASLIGTAYVAPPTDPSGVTRFFGPVLSGNTNPGMALLAKRVYIDASKGGSFQALINFPKGAILLWAGVATLVAFSPVGATISIGITSGGAEVLAAATMPTAGTVLTAPLLSSLTGGTAWFNYTASASSTGQAAVFLIYLWPLFPGTGLG